MVVPTIDLDEASLFGGECGDADNEQDEEEFLHDAFLWGLGRILFSRERSCAGTQFPSAVGIGIGG